MLAIESVYDPSFSAYGQVLEGYDTAELVEEMKKIPLPETGVDYRPSIEALEALDIFDALTARAYGEMPIQLGLCWGRNRKLNCLEYHRDSEINIGEKDFILLLAKRDDVVDGMLDTDKVRAFLVPAGTAVEVYATSLHYSPCHTPEGGYFRTAIVLPKGTNEPLQPVDAVSAEDKLLWARNKWLYAHPDAPEAADGACVGMTGVNIDLDAC